ncbi:MAG: peptidylprolyl isomerase, partial [Hominimerdicola sp.]
DSLSLSEKASAKQSAYSNLNDEQVEEAKEKAKQVAEEVLKKAKDGEDFNKLIEEYGWDIGLEDPTNGYYFNKDTTGFPESIVTGAFALEENEISSEVITDSTYGYFIIKRLPVELDYVNQNIDDMIYSYDTPALSELYQETMDAMTVTYCDNWDKIDADSIT